MLTIYHATLETRNFSFDVYAHSLVEAQYLMEQAWRKHAKATGATLTWSDVKDDLDVRDVRLNAVYRDGALLFPAGNGEPK